MRFGDEQLDLGIVDTFVSAFQHPLHLAGRLTGSTPKYCQYHRPIDSPDHLGCNRVIAADAAGKTTAFASPAAEDTGKGGKSMTEATWKPHEKHGRLTVQSDLPDSVYAFPKQRKEPLTDAQHVRNAVARFDQVTGVSDADRDLAFVNIEKAAKYYAVTLTETSWHDLGVHLQKKREKLTSKAL
jgi:hypothetical protein